MKKIKIFAASAVLITMTSLPVFAQESPTAVHPMPAATQNSAAPMPVPPAMPATSGTGSLTPTNVASPLAEPAKIPINCNYKISDKITHVDDAIVLTWAENAAPLLFDYDAKNIDQKLSQLLPCFSGQGYQSFMSALHKSGNIESIKQHKLSVSSQVMHKAQKTTPTSPQENFWEISLPLQVVYQNEQGKSTQLLHVKLAIGRQQNGDLGIMQVTATPQANEFSTQPKTTTDTAPAPSPTQPEATGSTPPEKTAPQPTSPDTSMPVQTTPINQPPLP